MTSWARWATCLVLIGAAPACEKSQPPAQAEPETAAAAPAVAPPAAETTVTTSAEVKLEAVPAREDFEEEAERQITATNLEQQLQDLEKEIGSD